MLRRSALAIIATLQFLLLWPVQAAEQNVGIVLLHGKWDRPPTGIQPIARQLEAAGFRVETPTMPWAATRQYDVTYALALEEIEAAANALRKAGAKVIVVGGQSFGANGALAFASSGKPVDAIFVLSPGHAPDSAAFRKGLEASIAKAHDMIKSGRGAETADFEDRNQAQIGKVRTSADSYYSYLDPNGLGAMSKTAPGMPRPLPVFMAVGSADPVSKIAKELIFDLTPRHEKSTYIVVTSDHTGVASAVAPALIDWLRSIAH